MQEEISTLKEVFSVQQDVHGSAPRANVTDSASSSDDAGSDEPINVIIGEPIASLLGVDGSHSGDDDDSISGDGKGDDDNSLKDDRCDTGTPPGYKRCFLCSHGTKQDNDNLSLCNFHNAQRLADAVLFVVDGERDNKGTSSKVVKDNTK